MSGIGNMNDVGESPIVETMIAWLFKLEPTTARQIVSMVEKWSSELNCGADVFGRCESPVERLFLLGFLLKDSGLVGSKVGGLGVEITVDGLSYCIAPQWTVYEADSEDLIGIADFCVLPETKVADAALWQLVVEVDGHEWHERTKEQAAHDKQRDRRLARRGYTVLRFTGSEVYASPSGCVAEVVATIRSLNAREHIEPPMPDEPIDAASAEDEIALS